MLRKSVFEIMRTSMRPSAALLLFLVLCVHGSQTFQLIRNNRLGGYPQPPFAGYPHQVPIYVRSSLDELPAPKPSFWPANQEAPRANEQFSLEIFSEIGQALTRYQDANIVLSPASVWALLTLLAEGATNNTFDELQQTLRLPADLSVLRQEFSQYQNFLTIKTPTVELLAGQALFSDRNQPVDPSYAARLSNDYHADHMPVNFRDANTASSEINSYISLRTGGKINNLIKPEDLTDAHLLLTSTIFFKGKWTFPFNISHTSNMPFYTEDGRTIDNVPMMYQRGNFPVALVADIDAGVLELPYGETNRLCMLILMPRHEKTLTDVYAKLRNVTVSQIIREVHKYDADEEAQDNEVDVTLPRFKLDSDLELRTVLERMGIKDLFNPAKARLDKLSRYQTFVSRVFHKAVIEVNEEGTVAAAATGGTISFKQKPTQFNVNKPFAFLIVERERSIVLFAGQVRQPLST